MGVEQVTTPTLASAQTQPTTIRSTDVGSEVVKGAFGLAETLMKQSLAQAGPNRIGKAVLDIQTGLGKMLTSASRVERDKYVTSRLTEKIANDELKPREIVQVKNSLSRFNTQLETSDDGSTYVVGPDKAVIGKFGTREGKMAQSVIQDAEKAAILLPKATASYEKSIGTKLEGAQNASVIGSAKKLTDFFEAVEKENATETPHTIAEANQLTADRRGMFVSTLNGIVDKVASSTVARKIGAADGSIDENAPKLVVQDIMEDLRTQLSPEMLRSIGMTGTQLEVMAKEYRDALTEFGRNAATRGVTGAAERVKSRMQVALDVSILKSNTRVWNSLPQPLKDTISSAGFAKDLVNALSAAVGSKDPANIMGATSAAIQALTGRNALELTIDTVESNLNRDNITIDIAERSIAQLNSVLKEPNALTIVGQDIADKADRAASRLLKLDIWDGKEAIRDRLQKDLDNFRKNLRVIK